MTLHARGGGGRTVRRDKFVATVARKSHASFPAPMPLTYMRIKGLVPPSSQNQ
jgi:hypothetical protein